MKSSHRSSIEGVLVALASVVLATAVGHSLRGGQRLADVVMVYMLGVVLVSMRYGYLPSIVAAVSSVLCFDFYFVPPYYTFAIADPGHLVTFSVMFVVALVVSSLTQRVRKQADEARKLAEEAREARFHVESERMRSALLSSISHDLRTPLAVVTGAASALLDDRIEEPARRDLTETIVKEAEQLERRLQNLLDMTRVEGGALRLRKQWQPLEEVVGTALRRTETILEGREVSVALPDAMVPIDASLLEQVLVNLLENAAKYTPPATPIRIGATEIDHALRVEVEDRGEGIPEEEAERVFDKFHRVRTDVAGAGLGLAICAGIVKAHGGRIWVEARQGGGASFRFTLPIEGEPPALENGELPA